MILYLIDQGDTDAQRGQSFESTQRVTLCILCLASGSPFSLWDNIYDYTPAKH